MIFETISKTFQTNSVKLNNMSLSGLFKLPKKSIEKGDLETSNSNNNKGLMEYILIFLSNIKILSYIYKKKNKNILAHCKDLFREVTNVALVYIKLSE